MVCISESFPDVFSGKGGNKPHCQRIRELGQNWGLEKMVFDAAGEKVSEIFVIRQMYLTDFLTYMTYRIQKADAEEAEYEYQEQLRKARKGR